MFSIAPDLGPEESSVKIRRGAEFAFQCKSGEMRGKEGSIRHSSEECGVSGYSSALTDRSMGFLTRADG